MVKTAVDYPVTLQYGQTLFPYYTKVPNPKRIFTSHHGIDYGAPLGTSVLVGGTIIGRVGMTGTVTGVHLHADKKPIGSLPTNRDSYRNPTGWQNISGVVTYSGDFGSAGNTVIIHTPDGFEYRFLHLSSINVRKGDKIAMDKITKAQEQVMSIMQTGSKPGKNYDYRFTGKPLTQTNLDQCLQFWSKQPRPPVDGSFTEVKEQLYRRK